ncbi:hypothetical protein HDU87_007096 [Geranomyces variabilis]|uniref:Mitochondrial carrier n=1 Tax=Geranomyces variabilis TaxID=109894 RepID=A0AAD5XKK6_9FUNG|nr:hypothetical protein HDU87_007096 [Geranomyces variabilis]
MQAGTTHPEPGPYGLSPPPPSDDDDSGGNSILHQPPPQPQRPRSESSHLVHVVLSGAIGGSVADACMHGLDTVKTRMQKDGTSGHTSKYSGTFHAARSIHRLEGFAGLFGGFRAAVFGSVAATTLYFTIYESTKHLSATVGGGGVISPSVAYFSAAALGEFCASFLYVPSEVVKTRMQLQGRYNNPHSLSRHNYMNDWHALKCVVKERRMYHGWGSTLARDIPLTAIQFTLYENIRALILRHQSPTTSPILAVLTTDILPGATSGFVAGLVTTPLDVVKTCLQTQGNPTKPRWQQLGATTASASLPAPQPTPIISSPSSSSASASASTIPSSSPAPSSSRGSGGPVYYDGMASAFKGIYKRRGLAGLFSGAWARAAWTGSQSTIMFFIYEALLAYGEGGGGPFSSLSTARQLG